MKMNNFTKGEQGSMSHYPPRIRKYLRYLVCTVLCTIPMTGWGHSNDRGKKIVVTGEVLDLACYFQHPESGQGPEHAACAKQCINKGLPAGLKVGNKLYLLLKKGHDPVAPLVAPHAGKHATISGFLIEEGGLSALVVDTIVEAKRGP